MIISDLNISNNLNDRHLFNLLDSKSLNALTEVLNDMIRVRDPVVQFSKIVQQITY